jgi:aryl-alcohol dehydrogenase-like predicted oxidoreductase
MSRIALGTAQFGLDYGINNQRGKIPDQEIGLILDHAAAEGVDTIDTASAYGDSEERIGSYLVRKNKPFKIVSKISKNAVNPTAELTSSLNKLKVDALYGYLFHDFPTYTGNRQLWEQVSALKEQGKVKKIGLSLYYPAELEQALDDGLKLDLIQVPYNIFDRRFEGYFPELKRQGVEVHVRSVFLQGLFFREIESLSPYFDRVKAKLLKLREAARQAKRTMLQFTLGFALANRSVDRIVVGVDNLRNLQEIIAAERSAKEINTPAELREDDESIILPFNWAKEQANA